MLQVAIAATLDTVLLRLPPATTTAVTATQAQLLALAVLQMSAAIRPTPLAASVSSNCLSHCAALTALPKSSS